MSLILIREAKIAYVYRSPLSQMDDHSGSLQMSNDVRMLLPMLVGIMVAKVKL